jgi:hypothetical protein
VQRPLQEHARDMAKKPFPPALPTRRQRGFEAAGGLLSTHLRQAVEKRGFAVARLLTHWTEVAGPDIAPLCRPVKIGHSKGAMGGTLTLLTTGAAGPMLQMQMPALRERVNACYGYNAIARIILTQTATTGFAEGQTPFSTAPKRTTQALLPQVARAASASAAPITNPDLRAALERLACNVLSRDQQNKGKTQ